MIFKINKLGSRLSLGEINDYKNNGFSIKRTTGILNKNITMINKPCEIYCNEKSVLHLALIN